MWRALVSLAGLVVVVAGLPAALIAVAGRPIPERWPSAAQWQAWAGQPMTMPLLRDYLACAGWVLWGLIIAAILLELVATITRVRVPRLRLAAPVQAVAASLVGTVVIAVAGTAARAGTPPSSAVTTPALASPATTATSASGPHLAAQSASAGHVVLVIGDCSYRYKVHKGDNLSKIARKCLGKASRWPEIWRLNRGKYWPHVSGHKKFSDPDLIYPGWVLTLPHDAIAPRGATQIPPTTTPKPTPSTTTTPAPTSTVSPASSATTVPTATSTVRDSGTPTGSASSAAATPPRAAAPPDDDGNETPNGASDGVHLPGGWISAGFAAALAAAAAMVWHRRRHRYVPTPITTTAVADPDLAPPLAALTLIRQQLRRSSPQTIDDDQDPAGGDHSPVTMPARALAGHNGAELAGVGRLPLSTGVGLTGPAALDAARGLLVATLTAGDPAHPDEQSHAVVSADTLTTLLGVSALDLGSTPRLTVTATFAEAVTRVEEEIIRRRRILAENEAVDIAGLRADDPPAEPMPQLLLIADVPAQSWQPRVSTAIALGAGVDIGAALIGAWPHGTTLTVDTDGTTSGGAGHKIAVLDTATTAEALSMLREAHTGHQPAATAVNPARKAPADVGEPVDETAVQVDHLDEPAPRTAATPTSAHQDAQPPPNGTVTVRILGGPAIIGIDGQPVRGLRTKSLELLVYLAVHRSGASLSDIMEALWPDATMRRAAERLSTCVANLRGIIRGVANDTSSDRRLEPVVNSGGHYRLDPTIVTVDWWTVGDENAKVAAATDAQQQLKHLQTALTDLHGPLADGTDYEWIDTDREHVRRTQINLYAQAAALLTDTDPHQARTLLDSACTIDPLSDELARRAMHAAAAVGDADAIRHRLHTLRQDLADARIDLDTDTENLAATLLHQLAHPATD